MHHLRTLPHLEDAVAVDLLLDWNRKKEKHKLEKYMSAQNDTLTL